MNKEVISDRQGIALIILFIIGSTSVFVMGLEAKKDIWIATLLALFLALPITYIYVRLHYIFVDKNLFDIIEFSFGKFIGRGIILLFTCFFLYWTTDVLVNYGNFIETVTLIKTPKIIPKYYLEFYAAGE